MRIIVALILLALITVTADAQTTKTPPDCYPSILAPTKLAWGTSDVTAQVSTRYQGWAVWTCKLSTGGYRTQAYMFATWEILPGFEAAAKNGATKTQLDTLFMAAPYDPNYTASEQAFITAKQLQYSAFATVAPINGGATTRPVYALDAQGFRQTSPVPNAAVKVGSYCDISKRIGTSRYYSVQGGTNTVDGTTLGDVYTECVFSAPMGVY